MLLCIHNDIIRCNIQRLLFIIELFLALFVFPREDSNFEDTTGAIRSCNSKEKQYNCQQKNDKIVHRKIKIAQHEPT
jgi:hypothetical protein